MSILNKLKEQLRRTDEVTVLELLDLSAEELVEAFPEKIIFRKAYITKELEMALDEVHEMKELNFD